MVCPYFSNNIGGWAIIGKTVENYFKSKYNKGGVPIKEVNVGNMHFDKGKTQISKKVYVDDQDMEDLRTMKNMGIYIQGVPGGIKEKIN